MTSPHAELLPAYLITRMQFLQRMRDVFALASQDEVLAACKRLKLFANGNIVLGNDQETDCLVDWMIFQYRRQGKSLSQIAYEASPTGQESAVLAAMANATLGLVRVIDIEAGIGLNVENLWTGQSQFLFEREVSIVCNPGDHYLLRTLVSGDITWCAGLVLTMPLPLLDAMRQEQAAGRLPSMANLAAVGPRQDGFLGSIIATVMPKRQVPAAPKQEMRRAEKIGRNDPCPCGSGKKYKKCCAGSTL